MSEKNQIDLLSLSSEVTDPNVVVIQTEPSPLMYIYKDLRICNSDSKETPSQTLLEKVVIHPLFTNTSGVLLLALLLEYIFSQIK